MQFQIQKRGKRRTEVQPVLEQVGDDRIINSAQWLGADGRRFHVFTLRDGKIADMQGFSSRRKAERFARR